MKIIFYSNKCIYCNKLLEYIDKHNLKYLFKLINIDITHNIPNNIDIVPTIIDTDLNQPLKSKKVFEYIVNIKYFNNSTNNIDYINNIPPNPIINEDEKAFKNNLINLEISELSNCDTIINNNNNNNNNTKLSILLKRNRH